MSLAAGSQTPKDKIGPERHRLWERSSKYLHQIQQWLLCHIIGDLRTIA